MRIVSPLQTRAHAIEIGGRRMRRIVVAWGIAFSAALAVAGTVASAMAQSIDISLPAGSMEWRYECQAGVSWPTVCSLQGKTIFSTADYASVTIVRLPGRAYWFRFDTEDKPVEFVVEGEQLVCSINSPAVKAARAWEAANPAPRARQ